MKKQKSAKRDWATNLERISRPVPLTRRLPPIQAKAGGAALPKGRTGELKHCRKCHQPGHNVRTCPNPRARTGGAPARRPTLSHKIIVAQRTVIVSALQGERVLRAAYDKGSKTLHLAFKGTFKTHWYAYANVPKRVYVQLLGAKHPDAIVECNINPKYQRTYVHRRTPK